MLSQLLLGLSSQEHIALWYHQVNGMKFESPEVENPNHRSRAKTKELGNGPDKSHELSD